MKNNESKQNLIASLLAILIGLLIGFIVILIANPSQAFRAMGIMMSGGFYKGLRSIRTSSLFCNSNYDDLGYLLHLHLNAVTLISGQLVNIQLVALWHYF